MEVDGVKKCIKRQKSRLVKHDRRLAGLYPCPLCGQGFEKRLQVRSFRSSSAFGQFRGLFILQAHINRCTCSAQGSQHSTASTSNPASARQLPNIRKIEMRESRLTASPSLEPGSGLFSIHFIDRNNSNAIHCASERHASCPSTGACFRPSQPFIG